jgi:hypothetical protein
MTLQRWTLDVMMLRSWPHHALPRFMNGTVTESTKPRGVVDLSKVQDVSQAAKATGRQYSFMLKTASGGRYAGAPLPA